jgi:hypothetical protein
VAPSPRLVLVALAASKEILDRAWGKAEAKGEVAVVHRFAQVPAVMSKEDWLRTRGDPSLSPGKPDPDPNLH